MLAGELHAHPSPDLVQVAALHVRVRPREVDELEHAQRRVGRGEADRPRLPTLLEDDDLAGLDVTDVLRADDVEAGRLGREAPAIAGARVAGPHRVVEPQAVAADRVVGRGQAAEDERPEAERIADADDPLLVEDDEAVGAVDGGQDAHERIHGVGCRLVGQERREELRVRRGRQRARPAAARASRAALGY